LTHMNAFPSRQLLIGGRWCPAASGHALDVFDPATGEVFAQAAAGGAEDIDSAVKAARHCAARWLYRKRYTDTDVSPFATYGDRRILPDTDSPSGES
jgi:hypothetical protein